MDTLEPAERSAYRSDDTTGNQAAGSRLRAIADQLVRLGPSRTNPHAFHETKSPANAGRALGGGPPLPTPAQLP